jgi:hypothetical protein
MLLRWGGAFTLTGFLCNGGLAGVAFFFTWKLADYQAPFAWKSIPLALFVTQRGFLFALPAGLLLLCSWRARFFSEEPSDTATPDLAKKSDVLPWWGELLLYASLPIFHFHTFLFLSLLLGAWFCMVPGARWRVFRLVAAAVVPATVLVMLITANLQGPSALGWKPGWMQDDPEHLTWLGDLLSSPGESTGSTRPWWSASTSPPWKPFFLISWPVFWLLNFGILPFLVALLAYRAWSERSGTTRAFVYPALGIFLLCCLVKFAPWEWDNTKVMVWSYLVVLPFLWSRLLQPQPFSVRVVACVALFASGFVSLLGGLNDGSNGSPIALRSELDELERDLRKVPPHQRFLARPNYNHPLLLLGQKVAMGYLGHIWSHGYEWQKRDQTITAIMNGERHWRELAAALNCRYLYWGTQERAQYPNSLEPWKAECRLVVAGEWGEIYDLHSEAETE